MEKNKVNGNPYDITPQGTPEGFKAGEVDPVYEKMRVQINRLRMSPDPADKLTADQLEEQLRKVQAQNAKDDLAKSA